MLQHQSTQSAFSEVLLWDMDGVLVDSEPLNIAKITAVLARYGIALREADMVTPQNFQIPDGQGGMKDVTMPLGGAGDKNIYWWAVAQRGEQIRTGKSKQQFADELTLQKWLDEILDYYIAHKDTLKPRDNMVDLIGRLAARGVVQGVVTAGLPQQVEANLSVLGDAKKHLAFVLNANDVKVTKPDPEGYLVGMKRVSDLIGKRGENPKGMVVVVVEDSIPGVRAALAAGAFCVQYLLPGQSPMEVSGEQALHFSYARTGAAVEEQVLKIFDDCRRRG